MDSPYREPERRKNLCEKCGEDLGELTGKCGKCMYLECNLLQFMQKAMWIRT